MQRADGARCRQIVDGEDSGRRLRQRQQASHRLKAARLAIAALHHQIGIEGHAVALEGVAIAVQPRGASASSMPRKMCAKNGLAISGMSVPITELRFVRSERATRFGW